MTPDYPLIVALEYHPLDGTSELIATYRDGTETRQTCRNEAHAAYALYDLARLEWDYRVGGHC